MKLNRFSKEENGNGSRCDERSEHAKRLDDDASSTTIRSKYAAARDRVRDKHGKYSIRREASAAFANLKSSLNGSSVGTKILAVIKFILSIVYIFFRSIWRILVGIAVMAIVCFVVGCIGVGYLYFTSADELPNIEDYTKVSLPQDSTIYDSDGEVIGVVSTVSRENIGFGEISQPMKDAIVAIEDERFYSHTGIDIQGIARALYVNFQSWRSGGSSTSQGASTLTQQYVRNAYSSVGTEQTMKRKLTEIMLSVQLEANVSKDDILNSYLNTVYFGNGCYGVESASQHYFGHPASELDYYESAVLSSIVNGPSIYDPETDEGVEATAERVNLVLDKMYSLGYLGSMTQDELRQLKSTDLRSRLHITKSEQQINQPFYYDYVMSELKSKYSKEEIESGGWQIYTTLSIKDGQQAEAVVANTEKTYAGKGITAALVDIDNETGAIHAFCGGTDYNSSQYNIATQGHLQTGSTLKPIVYAGLCEYDGYYMTDEMSCEKVNVGTDAEPHWITPYIRGDKGTLKQGIVQSDNAMTIHVAQTEGMSDVQKICSNVGIKTPIDDNVIATIGGQTTGLTPLELASAYSTIARGGQQIDYWCIKQITDGLGNEVYKHDAQKKYAISEEVALQITDAMKAAVDTAGWYDIPFDKQGWTIAAKTGTTNDDYDSWCVGFDHNRSVSLWVGGRDSKVTVTNSSHNTTMSFSSYFEKVGQNDSKEDFKAPQWKTQIPPMSDGESLEEYMQEIQKRQLGIQIEYVSAQNAKDGEVVGVKNENQLVNRGESAIIQVVRDMVAVPDFKGMTPEQVYNQSAGLDINFNVTYSTSGSSNPTVNAQSVTPGNVVAKGTEVTLDITMLIQENGDGTQIQVPTNGTSSALSMLQKERDQYKSLSEQLTQQLESSKSNDTSSNSADKVTVPNLIGLSEKDAAQVLQSLGLSVSYSGSSTATITGCSPASGTQVDKGSTVQLKGSSSSSSNSSNDTNNGNNRGNSSNASSSGSTTRR